MWSDWPLKGSLKWQYPWMPYRYYFPPAKLWKLKITVKQHRDLLTILFFIISPRRTFCCSRPSSPSEPNMMWLKKNANHVTWNSLHPKAVIFEPRACMPSNELREKKKNQLWKLCIFLTWHINLGSSNRWNFWLSRHWHFK